MLMHRSRHGLTSHRGGSVVLLGWRRYAALSLILAWSLAQPSWASETVPTSAGFEELSERTPLSTDKEAKLRSGLVTEAGKAASQLAEARTPEERYYALPRGAVAAFVLGNYADARSNANETLTTAELYKDNWNYGNAQHDGHAVLGLLALQDGDDNLAREELRLAGATPGSPQLASFGPSMHLAKAMLAKGYAADVLAYFRQCRRFWTTGGAWLDTWEAKVREWQTPNFTLHAYRL
ncbi:MAG: hypothetical protein U1F10_00495 [Burkholderiales bacterium]